MWSDRFKRMAKAIARAVFGEYSIYCMYSCAADPDKAHAGLVVEECSSRVSDTLGGTELSAYADYGGAESYCFVVKIDGIASAVAFYWVGNRYRTRGFIELGDDEAKLVQIVTLPAKRGSGLATELIRQSTKAMFSKGWRRLHARVWHSNIASRGAFERAGWSQSGWIVEINPLRKARAWRIRWGV